MVRTTVTIAVVSDDGPLEVLSSDPFEKLPSTKILELADEVGEAADEIRDRVKEIKRQRVLSAEDVGELRKLQTQEVLLERLSGNLALASALQIVVDLDEFNQELLGATKELQKAAKEMEARREEILKVLKIANLVVKAVTQVVTPLGIGTVVRFIGLLEGVNKIISGQDSEEEE